MAARYFPAVVERGATNYGITFPDFPGCVSVGDSIEHAIERGAAAAGFTRSGFLAEAARRFLRESQ